MPTDLLKKMKERALRSNRTLARVIEDALRESLARRGSSAKAAPFKLPTFRGDGLRGGVDIESNASLWETMDADDAR